MRSQLPCHLSQNPRTSPVYICILFGVLMSVFTSILTALLLAMVSLLADTEWLEIYSNWVIIAVIMVSIFSGSACATHKYGHKGLPVGIVVGLCYVLLLIVVGLQINGESITVLALINKMVAGSAAGALGGIVGVNL